MLFSSMRKILAAFLSSAFVFLMVLAPRISADDGSWNAAFSLTEGSLYSERENDDIALEDEILVFDGFGTGLTRALFLFKNSSGKDLTVDAGFPIRVRVEMDKDAIPGKEGQTGFFPQESMYGSGSSPLAHLRLALGDELHEAALPTDEFVGHSQYYVLAQDVPVRREIPPRAFRSSSISR
jgi:hypothetical protein